MKKLLPVLLFFLFPPFGFAVNNVIVQTKYDTGVAGAITPFDTSYTSSCTSGSTLIITIIIDGSPVSETSAITVSDPTNGAWTHDKDYFATFGANHERVLIASVHNTATTALTVSVFTVSSVSVYEQLYEVTGPPTSSFVDTSGQVQATTDPTITLTALANDTIIVGVVGYPTFSGNTDAGYTQDHNQALASGFFGAFESIADAGAAGSKTINWNSYTAADPTYLVNVAVAYKFNTGPPPSTVTTRLTLTGVGR